MRGDLLSISRTSGWGSPPPKGWGTETQAKYYRTASMGKGDEESMCDVGGGGGGGGTAGRVQLGAPSCFFSTR